MGLCQCMTFFPLATICEVLQIITCLMPNLCTVVITKTTTQNNCDIPHAQRTTTVQPNVFFFSWIHKLPVTNKGVWSFPSVNHGQERLQTPTPLSVHMHVYIIIFSWYVLLAK